MSEFPRRVGRYELLLPIGHGATATVYLARSHVVGDVYRDVAIKLVHPHLREELGPQLVDEAIVAAAIRHPNIVSVIEAGDSEHGVFLALEYIEGATLRDLQHGHAQRRLPLPMVFRIMSDVLEGLHGAHESREHLVHRDLSPSNVLVGIDGVARITDFGIAKASGRMSQTKTGHAKGTVPYMSPEQALGTPIDRRSDIWTAATVMWELVVGERLFGGDNETAVLLDVVTDRALPPPSSARPGLPVELDRAIAQALTRDAELRCPDAEELRRRLLAAWPGEIASHREVGEMVARIASEAIAKRRADAALSREGHLSLARSSWPATSDPVTIEHRRGRARWAGLAIAAVAATAAAIALWSRTPATTRAAAVPPPTGIAARPAPAEMLTIKANAPMVQLKIGSRAPLIVEPTHELTVRLSEQERAEALALEARSADGRRASTVAVGSAVTLTFAAPTSIVAPDQRPPASRPRPLSSAPPRTQPPRQSPPRQSPPRNLPPRQVPPRRRPGPGDTPYE